MKQLLLMLISLWFSADTAAGGQLPPLHLVGLDPQPNYPETADSADISQLADARMTRFPFWVSRESVGWTNRTPVNVTALVDLPDGGRYRLLFRTAMDSRADVYPPRRIDVYCRPIGRVSWRHSGFLMHERDFAEDSQVVNLAVPLVTCGRGDLRVVLNADGPYLMLDEISLALSGKTDAGAGESMGRLGRDDDVADPLADSRARLEASLAELAKAKVTRSIRTAPNRASFAWLDEPLSDLRIPAEGNRAAHLSLSVLANEEVSYVLGIANPGPAQRRYTVSPDPESAADTVINALMPVVAADGRLVFDPITDRSQATHAVDAGAVSYLLLREQPTGRQGIRQIRLSDDAGWKQMLTVDVRVYDRIRPTAEDQPRVIVWTYTNDRPIWRADTAAGLVSQLAASGVNVFDIHPAHIPMPFRESDWASRVSLLKADIKLYQGKGLVLLFLGDSAWKELTDLADDPETQRRLARWVRLLVSTLADGGFARNAWALYPIDEPNGEDLYRLARVIEKLRVIDDGLQFYANPTVSRGKGFLSLPALMQLRTKVDYWQPLAGEAFNTVATALGEGSKEGLWVYENPREPAKSASPACYRASAINAFDAGAHGMGFWSFSNTNGSSAWSDFDGQQPDWAVAYEAPPGAGYPFTSSRRWEGFKQGVRDFSALTYCSRQSGRDPILKNQCVAYEKNLRAALSRQCVS